MPQDAAQIKEKIVSYLRVNGPSLPVHISQYAGQSILFTSAFLSELLSDRAIKTSVMRVGSSPIYFLPGQEPQLDKYSNFLKSKEKEAYILLKEKQFLKDSEQEPAIRVALREIKDFAAPFEKNSEIIWRYFTTEESEFGKKLPEKETEKSSEETPEKKSKEFEENEDEISEENKKRENEHEEELKELEEEIEEDLEEESQPIETKEEAKVPEKLEKQDKDFKKDLNIFDEEKISESKKAEDQETKQKKSTSKTSSASTKAATKKSSKKTSKKPKEDSKFFNRVKDYLEKKNVEILGIEEIAITKIIFKVREHDEDFLIVAYNKKRITEEDILKAYKKSETLNLSYKILCFGEPAKKIENMINAAKSLKNIEVIE